MILLSRLCYIHLYLNFNVDKAIWQHIWYWSITDQIIIWTLIKSALNYSANQKPHVFNSLIRINDCFTIDWLRMMITNLLMKSRCQKHNSRTITYWNARTKFYSQFWLWNPVVRRLYDIALYSVCSTSTYAMNRFSLIP